MRSLENFFQTNFVFEKAQGAPRIKHTQAPKQHSQKQN